MLSRAIVYRNLSSASTNIGLSQPQLSRIVSKLEGEFKVVLLDRTSRRQSGWTRSAFQLVEIYSKTVGHFEREVQKFLGVSEPHEVRIGALEGLISLATLFCKYLFHSTTLRQLHLDIYDLHNLEAFFSKGELDVIFISREPAKKKYKYSIKLGYQLLESLQTSHETLVLSSFEYQTQTKLQKKKEFKNTLISNSLAVRKIWIHSFGGNGVIPSEVFRNRQPDEKGEPIFLIAQDLLSPQLWEKIDLFRNVEASQDSKALSEALRGQESEKPCARWALPKQDAEARKTIKKTAGLPSAGLQGHDGREARQFSELPRSGWSWRG